MRLGRSFGLLMERCLRASFLFVWVCSSFESASISLNRQRIRFAPPPPLILHPTVLYPQLFPSPSRSLLSPNPPIVFPPSSLVSGPRPTSNPTKVVYNSLVIFQPRRRQYEKYYLERRPRLDRSRPPPRFRLTHNLKRPIPPLAPSYEVMYLPPSRLGRSAERALALTAEAGGGCEPITAPPHFGLTGNAATAIIDAVPFVPYRKI